MDRPNDGAAALRDGEGAPLRSGELARRSCVSVDTLRHYERVGVLPIPERQPNGYRVYPPGALDRVRLVRRALAIGFTLAELARVLNERDRNGSPCRAVRALAGVRLAAIERELEALTSRRDALCRTLAVWDRRLAHTPRGRQARLLDHVADPGPAATRSTRRAGRNPPIRDAGLR